ncbi:hypothetical protein [Streptomyces pseudovenezuelae]|uniref:hypothetical protein n=1 Tax=Streptomyces pseudovenezuelae TaxID=67350 RepID=UPI0036EC0C13
MTGKPIPLRIAHSTHIPDLTAVEAVVDHFNLPKSRPPIERDDAVHIIVRDGDDFAAWVHALGGEIKWAPAHDLAMLYTLRTQTPRRADGSTVEIRVHVALVDGEFAPGHTRAVSA